MKRTTSLTEIGIKSLSFLFLLLAFIPGTGSHGFAQTARTSDEQWTVDHCRQMKDRVSRLDCFDRVFDIAPVIPETNPDQLMPQSVETVQDGPVRQIALDQEKTRIKGQSGWVSRIRPWSESVFLSLEEFSTIKNSPINNEQEGSVRKHQWTDRNVDVFLTMLEKDIAAEAALKTLEEKAILMVSCENDITSLYVILPKPIKNPRAQLVLSAENRAPFSVSWRDVENGRVMSAGRGLESIDFIKTLSVLPLIRLQVKDENYNRAFTFEIDDLRSRVQPLRSACHW